MLRLIVSMVLACGPVASLLSQSDSSRLRLSAYVDAYAAHYTDQRPPNALQEVATVSPRSDRLGLNVAQLGLHYQAARLRGNLVLHAGDIAQATWSQTFRNVQRANVGLRLFDQVWLDAGFFTTHIGTESFLPKNNDLSSTTVATYNEPFYQAGARLSYAGSERWTTELWLVNGYNFFLDANAAKSVGVLLSYALSDTWTLSYSNLLGRESDDGIAPAQFRVYQNAYLTGTLAEERLRFSLGGDLGLQSHSALFDSTSTARMYNALLTLRYQFHPQWSLTTRAEVFDDPSGFISGLYSTNGIVPLQGLSLAGLTLGGEYRPLPQGYLRVEGRYLRTQTGLVMFDNDFDRRARLEVMVTLGVFWEQAL